MSASVKTDLKASGSKSSGKKRKKKKEKEKKKKKKARTTDRKTDSVTTSKRLPEPTSKRKTTDVSEPKTSDKVKISQLLLSFPACLRPNLVPEARILLPRRKSTPERKRERKHRMPQ